MLDGGGGVRETRDYYPFGLPMPGRHEKGSPPTQEDFTGHVKDESTGLHYAGARYYSAAFSRWTTTDRFADKYPSMSPYQYAANNPATLIDVNGDTIWIQNGEERLRYTAGMECEDCTDFASSIVSQLNDVAGAEGGDKVVQELVGSKSDYNILNEEPSEEGATMSIDSKEGGRADIRAGKSFGNDRDRSQKIFALSGELFHGYQLEKGQNPSAVYSEVGSSLFAGSMQLRVTGRFPRFGKPTPSTPGGGLYRQYTFSLWLMLARS